MLNFASFAKIYLGSYFGNWIVERQQVVKSFLLARTVVVVVVSSKEDVFCHCDRLNQQLTDTTPEDLKRTAEAQKTQR
ncbi:hypothetical protein FM036_07250 [Nostoc sp. HG1]|nr:hypothetical protein [Nostoc sp. HG1]MCL6750206.1 hypothetical protein [Nostoc sp. CCCryo 231-06]